MNFEPIQAVVSFIAGGLYGTFGAVVHYLYELVKDGNQKFSFRRFFLNGVLGFFIGQLVGGFLPGDFAYRDGTLLLAGFLVYQLLDLIERKGLETLLNNLRKRT